MYPMLPWNIFFLYFSLLNTKIQGFFILLSHLSLLGSSLFFYLHIFLLFWKSVCVWETLFTLVWATPVSQFGNWEISLVQISWKTVGIFLNFVVNSLKTVLEMHLSCMATVISWKSYLPIREFFSFNLAFRYFVFSLGYQLR